MKWVGGCSVIEFIKKQDNNSLILFIHGFTGGDDTWSYSKVCSFPQLLADDLDISSSYDIATFSYYTKLSSTYSKTLNIGKFISNLFRTSHKKLKSNSSIEEISNLLRTEIRFNLASYDNIVVVAHSMGGLVTKSAIVKDIEDNSVSKIKLFLSLSVPHQGADAATFGSLVSKNIQIENLAPLNDFIHKINDFWLKTSLRPTTKYFYGVSDKVVSKTSAVPIDKEKSDVISVEENHTSITKPENVNNTTYCAVKQLILEHKNGDAATTNISIQKLDSDSEFSDELFVLKLLSANIHDSTIRSAVSAP
ncbi:hypothetical protein VAA_00145 [Vibrio anguillarum 775]|nr:alpha/beta hydrolase [Vibrio anguillarum]AEH33972.1 hypothetical protein VAA_00145 [Vibrio anguillarum 775]